MPVLWDKYGEIMRAITLLDEFVFFTMEKKLMDFKEKMKMHSYEVKLAKCKTDMKKLKFCKDVCKTFGFNTYESMWDGEPVTM